MLRLSGRSAALFVSALAVVIVAVEVWALSLPALAAWQVGWPAGWNARALGILLDLLIVVPLATLLLVQVWRRSVTATGLADVLPPWVKGWIRPRRLLYLLLPLAVAYLGQLELGLGALLAGVAGLAVIGELIAFGALAVKLTQLVRATRALRLDGYSVPIAVLRAAGKVFGFAAPPVLFVLRLAILEVTQLYYVTLGWLRRRRREGDLTFTYHRRRDETTLIGLLLMVSIEAVPVHLLLHHFSQVAAWIMTALHVYSALWVLGMLAAVRQRPVTLSGRRLRLAWGLFSEAVVDLGNLKDVRDVRDAPEPPAVDASFGSRLDVVLELEEPVTVYGLFGDAEEARTLSLALDEPTEFLEAVSAARQP